MMAEIVVVVLLAGLGGLCVMRVQRELDSGTELSTPTAALVWALYLIHLVATVTAAWQRVWLLPSAGGPMMAGGLAAVLLGAGLLVASVARFASLRRMSGTVQDRLVTGGVYRYSRNPQNVGLFLVLVGAALVGRSGFALLLAALLAMLFRIYVPIEERHLERTFGDEYRKYRRRTARWLGPAARS